MVNEVKGLKNWELTSYLPGSKLGQAIGDSSTFINSIPSAGLACFGSTTWQETWDMTLYGNKYHN